MNRTASAIILAAALGLAGPALAQQPAQTAQDQLVTIHANVEMQLAKQLDAANAKNVEEQTRITGLEKQIADLQKAADAAKPKTDEKAAPEKPAAPAPEKPK